jgi:hypothetical protein
MGSSKINESCYPACKLKSNGLVFDKINRIAASDVRMSSKMYFNGIPLAEPKEIEDTCSVVVI